LNKQNIIFFHKIREQEVRTGAVSVGWCQGKREDMQKGYKMANMVQVLCTRICTWKMRPVETFQELGERG
jgi:hypothetical protein